MLSPGLIQSGQILETDQDDQWRRARQCELVLTPDDIGHSGQATPDDDRTTPLGHRTAGILGAPIETVLRT